MHKLINNIYFLPAIIELVGSTTRIDVGSNMSVVFKRTGGFKVKPVNIKTCSLWQIAS